jgi:peptidoglycan/LPS O-acetylase OafA/YrhL
MRNFISVNPITRIDYRYDVNFLRALSIIGVVFYHADIKYFGGGWLGVDVFFVLSGYLISNIIISDINRGTFKFRDFYLRRVRRILPALFSTLLFSIPFAYSLLQPKELIEYSKSLVSSIFFYSNLYFRNLDFYNSSSAKTMPLLHTWSLGIEEQFYIIFPIIFLILFKKFKNNSIFIFSAFLIFSIILNSTNQTDDKFYYIQFRIWEFMIGVLIMFLNKVYKNYALKSLGLIIILSSFVVFSDSMVNQIEPKLIVLFGVFLFLVFGSSNSNLNFLIESKNINLVGNISFSMYLLHQPIFSFYRIYDEKTFSSFENIEKIVLIILLFVLSYFSWEFIEQYFIKTKKLYILFMFLFIALLIILFFYFGTVATNGYQERYNFVPDEVLFYSINTNFYPDGNSQNLKYWKDFSCDGYGCHFSNDNNKKTIRIIGDSHANIFTVSLLRNYENLSKEYNIVVNNGIGGRCIITGQHDSVNYTSGCERFYFQDYVETFANENDIIVLMGRFDLWINQEIGREQLQCESCDHLEEISERIAILSNSSKHLIIFDPHPTYDYPIARSYLNKIENWGNPIQINYSDWMSYVSSTKSFIKSIQGGNIINVETEDFFCNIFKEGKCNASTENELFYTDTNHLTFEGVIFLTDYLESIISNN